MRTHLASFDINVNPALNADGELVVAARRTCSCTFGLCSGFDPTGVTSEEFPANLPVLKKMDPAAHEVQ